MALVLVFGGVAEAKPGFPLPVADGTAALEATVGALIFGPKAILEYGHLGREAPGRGAFERRDCTGRDAVVALTLVRHAAGPIIRRCSAERCP